MQATYYAGKGSHVRVSFLRVDPNAGLSGTSVKLSCRQVDFTGVIKHFRGDHPTAPTIVMAYIDPDPGQPYDGPLVRPEGCKCDHEHVEIDPKKHIAGVL